MCPFSSFADWAVDCDFVGPVLRQYKRLWSSEASFNSYVASRGMDPWSVLFRCAVHASLAVCIAITPRGRSCCDSGAILWSLHCDHDSDLVVIPGPQCFILCQPALRLHCVAPDCSTRTCSDQTNTKKLGVTGKKELKILENSLFCCAQNSLWDTGRPGFTEILTP